MFCVCWVADTSGLPQAAAGTCRCLGCEQLPRTTKTPRRDTMYTLLRNRLRKDEEGFSLIELMVVVLILGVLMAIAVPTFMGGQTKAKDAVAKSDLRNAMTVAKTIAT